MSIPDFSHVKSLRWRNHATLTPFRPIFLVRSPLINLTEEEVAMSHVSVPVVECPKLVRDFCDGFKDLLPVKGAYQSFVALVSAAVFGVANMSDIARYFLFAPSVSQMCDFLSRKSLADQLNRRYRRRLLAVLRKIKSNPERYQFAIDDTLVPHSGKSMWGVYTWYDHTNKSYVNGHKILVVGVVDKYRNVLIPVAWEILHRDLSKVTSNPDKQGPSRVHETGWQVALRLLDQVLSSGFPKLPVSADSWFHGEDFCRGLDSREIPYVIEVKSNRIAETHGRKKIGKKLTSFFKDKIRQLILFKNRSKFASEAVLTLRDSDAPVKIVAVANRRDLDDDVFAYYASNQLTWGAAKIWGYSRGRWAIEVQFRELKQFFALGEAAVRSQQSIETAVSISMIALTVIRLEQLADADSQSNQYIRPIPAGVIVRDLKMQSLTRSILKLAIYPQKHTVQAFHVRYNRQNLNAKPAEVRRQCQTHVKKGGPAKAA